MAPEDDQECVRRVLAGDVEAFEGIVRRWQGPLVNLAWRFTHDRGRAEDLAQEAFLVAFRNLGKWRNEGSFSTWLFALATNVCRSAVRRLGLPHAFGERVEAIADARDLEHEAARREEHAAVRRALAALPPHYRDALVLFYFHDMDVDAASRTLGVPQGTLKARLARGRNALRKRLTRLTAGELAEEKR